MDFGKHTIHQKIHESDYGEGAMNFHVAKHGDTLSVELTYPPWTDADNKNQQCRYVEVNQEAVRASDGVRLHYDYDRDGFVIQQRKPILLRISETSYGYDDNWTEVGFYKSWALGDAGMDHTEEEYAAADAAWEARKS